MDESPSKAFINSIEHLGRDYLKLGRTEGHRLLVAFMDGFFYTLAGIITVLVAWFFLMLTLFNALRPFMAIEPLRLSFAILHIALAAVFILIGRSKFMALKSFNIGNTYH